MRCVIIDDDEISCKILENFVNKTEGLDLVDIYDNPLIALENVQKFKTIDLVFLDIEMPQMTGFEFLNLIDSKPQLIIVSAKEKYAIEAFDFDVTDYLLKPITYTRFCKGVNKAKENIAQVTVDKQTPATNIDVDSFFVKQNNSIIRLRYDDILWIEAVENYINICSKHEKVIIHQTLKSIEDSLPNTFRRVHRSYVVNISKIEKIEDNTLFYNVDGSVQKVPIGKSYREELNSFLNILK